MYMHESRLTLIKYFSGAEICDLHVLFQLILTKIPVGWILLVLFHHLENYTKNS